MPQDPQLPLRGVKVLDFGQYVAGPMAATLLADAGAEVIRVERPGGPSLDDPGNAYLLRDRARTLTLDLKTEDGRKQALALAEASDILIENFRPGVMARLGLGAEACRARNRGLIYCSLPGFGEDDVRAELAGWEGVVLAQGGAFSRPEAGAGFLNARAAVVPHMFPMPLASCFAAAMTALSATAALIARARDGGLGQRIEVPMSDALLEGSGVGSVTPEHRGPTDPFWALATGLYRSKDNGIVNYATTVFRHLPILARAAGREDLIESGMIDFDRLRAEPEHAARLKVELAKVFATRDATEWEALLGPAGVPNARYRTTREWLREPAAAEAGCVAEVADARYGAVRTLARAVEFEARPGAGEPGFPSARADAPPLAGFRVIDLSRVVAAPTAARLLGELGAEVIKVDSDPKQRQTSVTEPLGHVHINRGKQGAILDLKSPTGRKVFEGLLAQADAMVTNVSVSRLEPLGLGEDEVGRINPGLVVGYLNMHGDKGPFAAYRGYAGIADAATGLCSLTGGWEQTQSGGLPPSNPPWPHTDYVAGILGAFATVAALYARGRTGRTYRAIASLTRTSLLEQMPYAVDAADLDPARGKDITTPTYRLYTARDGMVFVAIHPDDLGAALDHLGIARPPADLVAALEAAIAVMSAEDCAAALCFANSSASAVKGVNYTMAADSPWARRGLRQERPSEDFGVVTSLGPTARFGRTPLHIGPTPRTFGTHQPTGWAA